MYAMAISSKTTEFAMYQQGRFQGKVHLLETHIITFLSRDLIARGGFTGEWLMLRANVPPHQRRGTGLTVACDIPAWHYMKSKSALALETVSIKMGRVSRKLAMALNK